VSWWNNLDPLQKLTIVMVIVLCCVVLYALFAPVGLELRPAACFNELFQMIYPTVSLNSVTASQNSAA
jgi:hypothetical protein